MSLDFIGAETVFDPSLEIEISKIIMTYATEGALYNKNIQDEYIRGYISNRRCFSKYFYQEKIPTINS